MHGSTGVAPHHPRRRPRGVLAWFAALAVALIGVTATAPAAMAAGAPDITLTVSAPTSALLGSTVPVGLTAHNPTGTDGYNAAYRLVLPAGVSLVSADPAATAQVAGTGGTTIVLWSNVADLLAGVTSGVTARVTSSAVDPATLTFTGGAYVNSDPRYVPSFTASGSPVASSYTGSATGSDSTDLVPFTVTSVTHRPENEIVRGVHDQKTVVSLTVDNNLVGPSSNLVLVDYLPAELEFLGCGTEDNSAAGTEEYSGSGRIDDTPAPAMADPCITPTSVDTRVVDPPGGQPNGVYTVVTWDSAALAAGLGSSALSAGGSFTIDYVTAVPQHANALFGGAAPTPGSAQQGSNLDNNTGASTAEGASETQIVNTAEVSGTYRGTGYSDTDEERSTLEDLAIQKGVSPGTIAQGQLSTWTLDLQVSEYSSTATSLVVTDTLPDGLCPLGGSSPDAECAGGPAPSLAYASTTENADGTWTLVWNVPAKVANDTASITFSTRTRTHYQQNGADAEPVRAGDSWTNTVVVDGQVSELGAAARIVHDASSAGQSATLDSLTKEVAAPSGGACGDGAGLTWESPLGSTTFGPGDTVCWRITAETPATLDSTAMTITDFLPAAYGYVGWARGSQSDVDFTGFAQSGQSLTWTPAGGAGDLAANQTAQVVVTTTVTDPTAQQPGDIVANLAKLSYRNTAGTPFQLRDQANAPWREPVLSLAKSASPTTATNAAPITYTVTVRNTGNQVATNVAVRDLLPTRIDCGAVSGLPAGFTCASGQIDGIVASVPPAGTSSYTYVVTLPSDVAPAEQFVNRAGVRTYDATTNTGGTFTYVPSSNIDPSLTPNTGPANAQATVTARSATIAKSHTTSIGSSGNSVNAATIGEQVDYTVTVTVPAASTIQAASITDTLPATLELLASPAPAWSVNGSAPSDLDITVSGNTITLAGDPSYAIPAGADPIITLTFSARVLDVPGAAAGSTISNNATLHYTPPGGSAATLTSTNNAPVVEPDIAVTKTDDDADGLATPGELVDFHVTATNAAGASVAYDTSVVDTIPDTMEPVDAGGTPVVDGGLVPPQNGVWDATARTITWTAGSMLQGTSTTFDYTVRVDNPVLASGTFTNSVTATTTSMPGTVAGERTIASGTNPSRYAATATDALQGPGATITKDVSPDRRAVGQAATYTVTVTVPGDVTTYDATIIDTLPAGLTYLDAVSADCTAPAGCSDTVTPLGASGQRVAWFVGDLPAQAQPRQFTIVYRAVVADVAAAVDGATLTNDALVASNLTDKVAGTPSSPPVVGDFDVVADHTSADVTVVEPHVTLDKNVSGAGVGDTRRVVPGESLTYSIVLSNTGTGAAYDVVVPDSVDPRMVPVSIVDGTGWSVTDADPSDGTLGFLVPTIPAGGSVTITYGMQVPALTSADEVPGPELQNTADATYRSAPDTAPGTPRAYDDVTPDTVSLEVDLAGVGDLVWFDANGDGVRGPGEPGLGGVPVTVTYLGPDGVPGGGDDEVFTTTTAADGSWHVDNLPGGAYRTSIDASAFPAGTSAGYDLDGSADGTADYTLGENEQRSDVDFGAIGGGVIGDLVWLDLDLDGTRNGAEPGLPGIGVDVTWAGLDGDLGTADDIVYQTVTAADGSWQVGGIPAGPIAVELDGATFPAGTAPVSDPDGGVADGSATGALAAAATDLTYDFGLAGTAALGNRVWNDTNRDGVQDSGEPGIPGATVQATWAGIDGVIGTPDDVVLTDTTGANGAYLFDNLPAGDVVVTVTSLPTALAPTYDEEHGTSGPTGSSRVTLATGERHLTADLGYVAGTGVGRTVWLDLDGNGAQDAGEPGIPGVEVTVTSAGTDGLLDTADDIVTTTTTDAEGHYLVTGRPATPTRVQVTGGLPGGLTPTADADGIGTPGASEVTLSDGVLDLDQDFGYQGANSVGDLVWFDANADGSPDAGEPGLPGVGIVVTLLGADGAPGGGDDIVVTTVTDAAGAYGVAGLPDGSYTVEVVSGIPAGYAATYDETGTADGSSVVDDLGTVGPRDHLTADVGYTGDGALGGTIWFDTNRDGSMDGGAEPRLGGIGVDVGWAGPDGVMGTPDDVAYRTTTGTDGEWVVENLPPGPYVATVDVSTLPTGVEIVFDRDSGLTSPDGVWTGALGASERRLDVDTGVSGDGAIGDTVWVDANRNGSQDPDEHGAPGVTVEVTWLGPDGVAGGGDDVTFTTSTDATGGYEVIGLPPGEYVVTIDADTIPDGTSLGSDLDGGDAGVTAVTLGQDEQRTDVDFALHVPPAALAFTGAAIAGLVLVAGFLLALGVLLLVIARRRPEAARG